MALEFINETTLGSAAASLSVTNVFSADYDIYQITFTDTELAALDWVELRFINSGDAVVSDSEYDEAVLELDSGGAFGESKEVNDTNFSRLIRSQTLDTRGGDATMYIFNPLSDSLFTYGIVQSNGVITNGFGTKGVFCLTQASSITGFQIYLNGGSNINKSTIRTYGLKVE